MNKKLASILRDKLTDIPIITLFGGLVYTQRRRESVAAVDDVLGELTGDVQRTIEKTFPVTCDWAGQRPCEDQPANAQDGLIAMVPDSTQKGIMYFEGRGARPQAYERGGLRIISFLRLVVWLNTKHLDVPNSCTGAATPVMTSIIEKFIGQGKNPFNEGDYKRVVIGLNEITENDSGIFSQYSYDEARTQFIMPPYEYFALDFQIEFFIKSQCVDYAYLKEPESC